jgi:hypothetical protein
MPLSLTVYNDSAGRWVSARDRWPQVLTAYRPTSTEGWQDFREGGLNSARQRINGSH